MYFSTKGKRIKELEDEVSLLRDINKSYSDEIKNLSEQLNSSRTNYNGRDFRSVSTRFDMKKDFMDELLNRAANDLKPFVKDGYVKLLESASKQAINRGPTLYADVAVDTYSEAVVVQLRIPELNTELYTVGFDGRY